MTLLERIPFIQTLCRKLILSYGKCFQSFTVPVGKVLDESARICKRARSLHFLLHKLLLRVSAVPSPRPTTRNWVKTRARDALTVSAAAVVSSAAAALAAASARPLKISCHRARAPSYAYQAWIRHIQFFREVGPDMQCCTVKALTVGFSKSQQYKKVILLLVNL